MQNRHDLKEQGWRQRLDGLSELPGESFIADASWRKLEARLVEKPRRKKYFGFWLAAASVLMILLVPGWSHHNKLFPKKPLQASNSQRGIPIDSVLPTQCVALPAREKRFIAYKKQTEILAISPRAANLIQEKVLLHPEGGIPMPDTLKENSVIAVASIPTKAADRWGIQRMPVIHINELDRSVLLIPRVADNTKKSIPRLQFFNAAASENIKEDQIIPLINHLNN